MSFQYKSIFSLIKNVCHNNKNYSQTANQKFQTFLKFWFLRVELPLKRLMGLLYPVHYVDRYQVCMQTQNNILHIYMQPILIFTKLSALLLLRNKGTMYVYNTTCTPHVPNPTWPAILTTSGFEQQDYQKVKIILILVFIFCKF